MICILHCLYLKFKGMRTLPINQHVQIPVDKSSRMSNEDNKHNKKQ